MRDWTYLVLLGGMASVSAWACGSEVENTTEGSTTSSSSAGGAGGAMTTSSSSSASSTSSGMQTPCEQACDHIDDCSGVPGACNIVGDLGFVDITTCSDMQAECAATCLRDASCASLITLVQGPLDPSLETCLTSCFPPCTGCVVTSCPTELQQCTNDSQGDCPGYLQCINGCGDTDTACIAACATTHPGAATDAVVACAANNCSMECGGGAGGAGGAGGGGGAGGANTD